VHASLMRGCLIDGLNGMLLSAANYSSRSFTSKYNLYMTFVISCHQISPI
jgi:hypothetical protein